jgi:hypothetical protein
MRAPGLTGQARHRHGGRPRADPGWR